MTFLSPQPVLSFTPVYKFIRLRAIDTELEKRLQGADYGVDQILIDIPRW